MSNLKEMLVRNVEALYPRIDQPYRYDSKAGEKGGSVPCDSKAAGAEYTINFKMDKATAKELFTEMVTVYEKERAENPECKNWPPFTENPFKKNDDGTFTHKSGIDASWDKPPAQIDAATNSLPTGFKLTTGSIVNLHVQLYPYSGGMGNGVKLRLFGVQVIDYKEYEKPSLFGVEKGFVNNTEPNSASVDNIFDTATESVNEDVAEEVVEEPKVKVSKKKKAEKPADVDLASLLDEFDD